MNTISGSNSRQWHHWSKVSAGYPTRSSHLSLMALLIVALYQSVQAELQLTTDVEWRLIYVGSAKGEDHDQELDSCMGECLLHWSP